MRICRFFFYMILQKLKEKREKNINFILISVGCFSSGNYEFINQEIN